MLERLLLALILCIAGVVLWRGYNRYSLRRLATTPPPETALSEVAEGVPVILYFTTPFCTTCRTQQQPVLAEIGADFGARVQIIRVDATEDPAAADRWGVFSAPTTFVLDAELRPRHVNRGVATRELLREQLEPLLPASA
jgi:thiol-disulfide isomerase/thioredoxin